MDEGAKRSRIVVRLYFWNELRPSFSPCSEPRRIKPS